jgi:signal transduction histidine kinase
LIQATAQRITANNLSERIPVPAGGGEMAALVRFLNEMIDRLEKSFKHAKRFTADVSHELMTPLSVIRLHTERLLNDPELPAKHRHSVEEQLQETLFLTEIIERLLLLAKADASVLVLKPQSSIVDAFMAQFAEDARLLAEDRGLKLVLAQGDGGVVVFDQGWIRQVLFNLLSNALRFSPPGATITIYSKCADGYWNVEVQDEGPGVPPERVEDIFGRFVQITARSGPGSGAGLGLAICKSIIDMHRGRISARLQTEKSGLVVTFSLPLIQTPMI